MKDASLRFRRSLHFLCLTTVAPGPALALTLTQGARPDPAQALSPPVSSPDQ
jgi:hypothetical protein